MVSARELRPVRGIVDPSDMDDDDGVHTIAGDHLAYDPSKVVTDPSQDPRGTGAGKKDPLPAGPVVLPVTGPLPAAEPAIRQVQKTTEQELSEFVASLDIDPAEVGLLPLPDVQIKGHTRPSTPAYTAPKPSTPAYTGDALERAYRAALGLLASMPKGCELFVGGEVGTEAVELAMGLGYLVGKGMAVYRGDGHYRITDAGRTAWAERNEH